MTPSPDSAASNAPLPPLPDMNTGSSGVGQPPPNSGLAAIISGIAPVKMGVDQIQAACKQIVQSGFPGADQVCAQIIALSTSLLSMAATSAMQPMGSGGAPTQGGMPPIGGQ